MTEETGSEKKNGAIPDDDMRELLRTDPDKWREIRMNEIRRLLDGNKSAVQSAPAEKTSATFQGSKPS